MWNRYTPIKYPPEELGEWAKHSPRPPYAWVPVGQHVEPSICGKSDLQRKLDEDAFVMVLEGIDRNLDSLQKLANERIGWKEETSEYRIEKQLQLWGRIREYHIKNQHIQ